MKPNACHMPIPAQLTESKIDRVLRDTLIRSTANGKPDRTSVPRAITIPRMNLTLKRRPGVDCRQTLRERSRPMTDSTIDFQVIKTSNAADASQRSSLSLQRASIGRHRPTGIQQSTNFKHCVKNDLRACLVGRVVSCKAVQCISDLRLDLVHQNKAVATFAPQMCASKRQVGCTGEEKSHTIGLVCRIGGWLATNSLIFRKLVNHRIKLRRSAASAYVSIFAAHTAVNTAQPSPNSISIAYQR